MGDTTFDVKIKQRELIKEVLLEANTPISTSQIVVRVNKKAKEKGWKKD